MVTLFNILWSEHLNLHINIPFRLYKAFLCLSSVGKGRCTLNMHKDTSNVQNRQVTNCKLFSCNFYSYYSSTPIKIYPTLENISASFYVLLLIKTTNSGDNLLSQILQLCKSKRGLFLTSLIKLFLKIYKDYQKYKQKCQQYDYAKRIQTSNGKGPLKTKVIGSQKRTETSCQHPIQCTSTSLLHFIKRYGSTS